MKADRSFVAVAYMGTFRVDPETADVISMTIITGDLPLATLTCQTTTTMDFTRVQIGEAQFLLPKQARQHFIYPDAEEVENTTSFTNCREFRGKSTVTYSPAALPMSEAAKAVSTQLPWLPPGLRFSLVLTAAIPTGAAAAGDPFSAKLADALRDAKGKVLAPKGALVEGRLMRVQCYRRPPESIIVLKPEKLWVRGAAVPLSAARDWTLVLTDRARQGKKGIEILVPLRGEDNSGVFRFSGDPFTVPAGFRSEWRTVSSSTTDTLAPNRLSSPRPL